VLNPNLGDARSALARVFLHLGFQDEALEQLRAAVRLDPSDLEAARRMSHCYFYRHEHERVLAEIERTGDRGSWFKANTLMHLGRVAEALTLARRDVDQTNEAGSMGVTNRSTYALVLARTGRRREAVRVLADLATPLRNDERYSHRHHAQYNAACAYALLGQKREALRWLRTAVDEGFPCYPFYRDEPSLAGLRGDPEFDAFMAGFEKRWQHYRTAVMGR
jgi:adenylate cyclase